MSTPWNLWVKQMVLILECLIQLNSTTKGAHVGLFSLYFWPCLVKLYRTWLKMGCDNLSEKQLTYKPPPTPFLKVGCQSFLSSFFESEVKLSLIKPWLFLFLVVRSKSFWGGRLYCEGPRNVVVAVNEKQYVHLLLWPLVTAMDHPAAFKCHHL